MNTEMKLIDSHCHFFHKGNMSARILRELVILRFNIERITKNKDQKSGLSAAQIHDLLLRTKNILNLIFSRSAESVMNKLQRGYGNMDVIYVPLSYDLISCFQEEYDQELEQLSVLHKTLFKKIKQEVYQIFDRSLEVLRKRKYFIDLQWLNDFLDKYKADIKNYRESELNLYSRQIKELEQLAEKYKGSVFPFYYVDPRRRYTLERFKELVGPGKPFLGIKMYTPNGYSPLDPRLDQVYTYCEKNQIPITVHNAFGGFSNFVSKQQIKGYIFYDGQVMEFDGWLEYQNNFFINPISSIKEKAQVLNHPKLWEKVLEHYPKLYLNLAHFGGDDYRWQEYVFKLLTDQRFENVYTDLSCQTERHMLYHIRRTYFRKLSEKFLYGSDFYLNMFFINTFQEYFNNFLRVFTRNERKMLMWDNPRRFLFLRGKDDWMEK